MTTDRPTTADILAFAEEMLQPMQGQPLELVVAAACVVLTRIAKAHPVGRVYIASSLTLTAQSISAGEFMH